MVLATPSSPNDPRASRRAVADRTLDELARRALGRPVESSNAEPVGSRAAVTRATSDALG